MEGTLHSPLASWEAFYVIIGSSAAALTGLQFVVMVLGSESNAFSDSTTRAFGTPTIVHFCAVLLIAAILTAPWHGLMHPAIGLGACGIAGAVYIATVVRRMKRQTDYAPVLEDWTWHGVIPIIAYAGLVAAAIVLPARPRQALFAIGGSAVLLLFVGIHNAWDAVAYIALRRARELKVPEP